ncbi:hypothetical protein ACFE04_026495 [Oxalis oulophora]
MGNIGYEVWINNNPGDIHKRRNNFFKWMGLSVDHIVNYHSVDSYTSDRITDDMGAILGSSAHINNNNNNNNNNNEMFRRLQQVRSNRFLSIDDFERGLGLSPLLQNVTRTSRREVSHFNSGFLRRLGTMHRVLNGQVGYNNSRLGDPCPNVKVKKQLVRVRSHKNKTKELSALYMRQDFQAHAGSISTMKFSHDGHYLASAGEDNIIRVWQIVEVDRSCEIVGSITGKCHFIDASDNHLQLRSQVCLHGKKKSALKRITSFQFFLTDPNILMVTSADSQVRLIFRGSAVICKFQGWNGTSTTGHCKVFPYEVSKVLAVKYVHHSPQMENVVKEGGHISKPKNIKSCEHFFSNNASLALPWCGFSNASGKSSQFSSPENLSTRHEIFSEPLSSSWGLAKWPEEKLQPSSPISDYRFKTIFCWDCDE